MGWEACGVRQEGRRAWLGFALAAGLSPLLYALYTDHIWEDFFITFRHCRNLCDGHGLVYDRGERVQGFSSPLGALLLAFCHLLAGARSYHASLWVFRGVSIAAFVGGGLLLWRRLGLERADRGLSRAALAVLYVLEVKGVSYSINGMETAFMLLFLAWQVTLLGRDVARRGVFLGLAWAGLMWTRPDGCVYIVAMSVAELAFGEGTRWRRLRDLGQAGLVCALLYLPWFAWAWAYYGSPVPQTVLAKTNLVSWASADLDPIRRYVAVLAKIFLPVYYEMGDGLGWYPGILSWSTGLGIFCASYWLLPLDDRLGRGCSLAFAVVAIYMTLLNYMFPWYAPPELMLGLVVLARGVPALTGRLLGGWRWAGALAAILLGLIAAERALMYTWMAYQMKVQTAEVEMGNRAKIGLWLKRHMSPGETVYLEPIGYIGFFSDAKVLDWPGLVSPRVSDLARREGRDFYSVVPALNPDWVVLRPWETQRMFERVPGFANRYELTNVFDVNPRLKALPFLPGRMFPTNDAAFAVFRRRSTRSVARTGP